MWSKVIVILYDDLVHLPELVPVGAQDIKHAALAVKYDGVDHQACLLLYIIPGEVSHPGS